MAGKSTYLRQVALIAIMAHAGCFVPAKFAAMQVIDRLLARLGTSDCIEHNSSSFLMEMQASFTLAQPRQEGPGQLGYARQVPR